MKRLYNCPKCLTSWNLKELSEQKYWCESCKVGIILKGNKFRIINRAISVKIAATLRMLIFIGLAGLSPSLLVHSIYARVFGIPANSFEIMLIFFPSIVVGLFIFTRTKRSFTRFSDWRETDKTFEHNRHSRWRKRGVRVRDC